MDTFFYMICFWSAIIKIWINLNVVATLEDGNQDIFLNKDKASVFLHHRSKRSLSEECREGCYYEEAREVGMTDVQIKSYMMTYKCSCCISCSSGYYCSNTNTDYSHINNLQIACKRDGGWTNWSLWASWSSCSATCEYGTWSRSRTRSCTNPTTDGGVDCVGSTSESETSSCIVATCIDVLGTWTSWSSWTDTSSCPVTCGGSVYGQSRTRNCSDSATTTAVPSVPEIRNVTCVGSSDEQQNVTCNTNNCPVDGDWTVWSNWTDCSVTCGNGTITRSRDCTNPSPQYGGNNCSGNSSETDECSTNIECLITCSASQYTCSGDGLCIASTAKCDGTIDCSQGDDEQGCSDQSSGSHGNSTLQGLNLWMLIGGCILGFLTLVVCFIVGYKVIRTDRNKVDGGKSKSGPYKVTKVEELTQKQQDKQPYQMTKVVQISQTSQRRQKALNF